MSRQYNYRNHIIISGNYSLSSDLGNLIPDPYLPQRGYTIINTKRWVWSGHVSSIEEAANLIDSLIK